jgi:uncharacterized membrane protein
MRRKNLDLMVALIVVVLNVVWTEFPNHPLILGIMLALPLTLLFPGYTLTQVLFRKRSPDQSTGEANALLLRPGLRLGQPIGSADQVVLSLGLSLAIDILVGFALNILPIGLRASSWALSLGLLITLFALLAALLRQRDVVKTESSMRPHITLYDGTLFVLALLLASTAVWFAIIRPQIPRQSFTQFWMLPASNKSCAISIGIQSFETAPVSYRVVMTINGARAEAWSPIVLAPQGKWDRSVVIKPETTSSGMYIEAQLYRLDEPGSVYRDVHISLHSLRESGSGQIPHCVSGSQ